MITGESQTAAGQSDSFSRAWQSMRADPDIQFDLRPPPAPAKPPAWLESFFQAIERAFAPIGRFLKWISSFFPDAAYARIILWTVIAVGAATLLWALYNRIRHGEWRLRRPTSASAAQLPPDDDWKPEAAAAREWLEEADALARQGRFAEAIRHLLFRSIDDIARQRPAVVRPALTSRELAASQSIPGRPRELFAAIARLVERSLFGQRPVSEGDWRQARETYSNFALPASWQL